MSDTGTGPVSREHPNWEISRISQESTPPTCQSADNVLYLNDTHRDMSALFNFQSLLLVILLFICTCTYVRAVAPGLVDRNKAGFLGLLFKAARIGERLSPYVALACIAMAITMLLK